MATSTATNIPVYAVIMAGGSGERFWPLSRAKRPKQLLALGASGKTMLAEAIERIAPIVPVANVLVITSKVLCEPIAQAVPELPLPNIIAEPCKRNTAPCLALAAAHINVREQGRPALMAVLTADHFIGNEEQFRHDVGAALEYANAERALVTLGVRPSRPETGYGYIETMLAPDEHHSGALPVVAFREKPDYETAMEYLVGGRHLWNSGMFFWRVDTFRDALVRHLPAVGNAIATLTNMVGSMADGSDNAHPSAEMDRMFATLPDISIDYGLMERATNVAVVPASFPWDDVGAWDALSRLNPTDALGNVVRGNSVLVHIEGSVIINEAGAHHVVTALGLHDVVIVTTPDATLVCAKSAAQDVKSIVKALKDSSRTDVL